MANEGSGGFLGPDVSPEERARDAEEIARLEAEIADLEAQRQASAQRAKELMAREAAGEGPFAAEIFAAGQDKMRLATEVQHRKVRINAIMLGVGRG